MVFANINVQLILLACFIALSNSVFTFKESFQGLGKDTMVIKLYYRTFLNKLNVSLLFQKFTWTIGSC